MRRVAWLAALLLFVTPSTLAITCSPAWACSCLQESDAQRFESSSHVFVGTPVSSRKDDSDVYWTFEVEKYLKGKAASELEVAVLRSEVDDCGYEIEIGRRYQIFASEFGSEVRSGKCAGNRLLGEGEEPYKPTAAEKIPTATDGSAPTAGTSAPAAPGETSRPTELAADEGQDGGIPPIFWPITAGLVGVGYWAFRRWST